MINEEVIDNNKSPPDMIKGMIERAIGMPSFFTIREVAKKAIVNVRTFTIQSTPPKICERSAREYGERRFFC